MKLQHHGICEPRLANLPNEFPLGVIALPTASQVRLLQHLLSAHAVVRKTLGCASLDNWSEESKIIIFKSGEQKFLL